MASPTLDTVCCSFRNMVNQTNVSGGHDHSAVTSYGKASFSALKNYLYLYNGTVIVMSIISVMGALYVLYPKQSQNVVASRQRLAGANDKRQKWILFWLSFADIMACMGLTVLSSASIHILTVTQPDQGNPFFEGPLQWVCILATAWIHFFFLATYMWITCYAVDVYLFLRKSNLRGLFKVYFIFSWLLPIALLTVGLWALYHTQEPELACTAKKDTRLLKVFYLCLFLPLVAALVINPIMYFIASRKVSPLMKARGMYTDREREIERQVQQKFLKIVIVFLCCWLPNVINGCMLLSGVSFSKMAVAYYITWILMAILNPLQAFLNTLVYWGPTGCAFLYVPSRARVESDSESEYLRSQPPWRDAAVPSDAENTPLLRGRARDTLN